MDKFHELGSLGLVASDLIYELFKFILLSLDVTHLLALVLFLCNHIFIQKVSMSHLLFDFLALLIDDFLFGFKLHAQNMVFVL
jgi:hypothetical protein